MERYSKTLARSVASDAGNRRWSKLEKRSIAFLEASTGFCWFAKEKKRFFFFFFWIITTPLYGFGDTNAKMMKCVCLRVRFLKFLHFSTENFYYLIIKKKTVGEMGFVKWKEELGLSHEISEPLIYGLTVDCIGGDCLSLIIVCYVPWQFPCIGSDTEVRVLGQTPAILFDINRM